jgi:alanine dehydrogenase
MIIGIPKEIKDNEFRVSTIPAGVKALTDAGHTVYVEKDAGIGSSITNEEYIKVGAKILNSVEKIWDLSEMIVKVKEPIKTEYKFLKKGQILFTYLHLAASLPCTKALLKSKVSAIAYETVEENNTLPLLAPMSEVAGRMSIQVGASALQKPNGGRGVLLGGVPGVAPGKVVILGGGTVGVSAATMALGLRADVTILDTNLNRLSQIDQIFQGQIRTIAASSYSIEEYALQADLLIGAVLIKGAKAPKLITDKIVEKMKHGSVLVDVAIDQGGCFEGSKPTTHSNPTYKVHNSLYYCVANMPGALPTTSTTALSNATLKYTLALANKGLEQAISEDPALKAGLNTHNGEITYQPIKEAHSL